MYLFWGKHLCCLRRRVDSSIEPDHSRCNSFLRWRRTGHFYCQDEKRDGENEGVREGMKERREQRARHQRERREWASQRTQASGAVKTSPYRFCHGCATLTASCSTVCLSHVGWLLMEPSYPGWTSVMTFYSPYWIWRWDLCVSHSCSLAFIAQPQPSCRGRKLCACTQSAAWSPARSDGIAAPHCSHC